jgi:hypothetical protein
MKKVTLIGYVYTATASHSGNTIYLEDTNTALNLTSYNTFHEHETTDKRYTHMPQAMYEEGDVTVLWNQAVHTRHRSYSK